ncbi:MULTISPECIES: gliding motility protein GldC [Emticicia]|uniref:gliding motility protein GldC n=1 Tax=Emticicia TaxID=312278 RepID=UPI000C779A04|nr:MULTISPECIES: gliding motility protein GldC [Emticicia]PLK43643.1 gliding motility protein GldC [Emticicia sp. TH156]UTA70297.1 gliding motility protein GldC [Emticicia sp. 21SJ11W-3]
MKKSEINFTIELDAARVPEKIFWDATENPNEGINESKAISISVWDHYHKGLLGINLWTKEMATDEMKHFAIDIVGNVAQMISDATGDKKMIEILESTCRSLKRHLDEELKNENQQ